MSKIRRIFLTVTLRAKTDPPMSGQEAIFIDKLQKMDPTLGKRVLSWLIYWRASRELFTNEVTLLSLLLIFYP